MNEPEFLNLDKLNKPTPPESDSFNEAAPPQPEPHGEAEPPQVDSPLPSAPSTSITFQGNNYDLAAFTGLTTTAMVLLSCGTCGGGFYCLPFIPIVLGIIGLVTANESVDPERTKKLSWISLGVSGTLFLLLVLAILAYMLFIVAILANDPNMFK